MIKISNDDRFTQIPDAILFDTDNTLYHYDPAHALAMNAVRGKVAATFSLDPDDFDKAYASARSEVKLRLKDTAASHSRLLYLQRMLEIIGLGSQVLVALDLEQTYWRTFLSNAVLFDDVKELLDDIRLLGIPTAIVTDLTAQIQFRKIVYFGLDRYFDYIVTSEEAGYDKPHGAQFELALKKVRPNGNCIWMIGDNPVNDIGGARRRIDAVTLQKLHNGVQQGQGENAADAVFQEFGQVRKLLERLGAAH